MLFLDIKKVNMAEQQQQQQQQQRQQRQQQQKRKKCLDRIHFFFRVKKRCLADLAYMEYVVLCSGLWKEYNTHFNYRFNICGSCRQRKHRLVKSKWCDSELYPTYGQMACLNKLCKFYLVINTDEVIKKE